MTGELYFSSFILFPPARYTKVHHCCRHFHIFVLQPQQIVRFIFPRLQIEFLFDPSLGSPQNEDYYTECVTECHAV